MPRDAIHGFLQIGVFVGLGGLILAFLQPPESAEFVVSVCSAVIGWVLVLAVILVARWQR